MIYRLLYNTGNVGCNIYDYEMLKDFARYMTTKDIYPVCVLKIKLK